LRNSFSARPRFRPFFSIPFREVRPFEPFAGALFSPPFEDKQSFPSLSQFVVEGLRGSSGGWESLEDPHSPLFFVIGIRRFFFFSQDENGQLYCRPSLIAYTGLSLCLTFPPSVFFRGRRLAGSFSFFLSREGDSLPSPFSPLMKKQLFVPRTVESLLASLFFFPKKRKVPSLPFPPPLSKRVN